MDCPATGTSSHFRATQAPSHRIASCLAPPSVSSTTSTATRHHQARQNISSPAPSRPPPRHWSYPAVPSSKPIPDRRLLLGVRVRSCLAWSDAGSGQSTVDSRQGSLSQTKNQTKKKIGEVQLSEIRTAAALPALHPPPSTLHRDRPMLPQPSPNPSSAPVSVPRPRPRPRPPHRRVPQQQPSCCRLSSPVARRPSLARVARLPHAPARTRDALPPPPDCPPPSESIEPATRHHPASSPTPSTIATSRDPDHPSAP